MTHTYEKGFFPCSWDPLWSSLCGAIDFQLIQIDKSPPIDFFFPRLLFMLAKVLVYDVSEIQSFLMINNIFGSLLCSFPMCSCYFMPPSNFISQYYIHNAFWTLNFSPLVLLMTCSNILKWKVAIRWDHRISELTRQEFLVDFVGDEKLKRSFDFHWNEKICIAYFDFNNFSKFF